LYVVINEQAPDGKTELLNSILYKKDKKYFPAKTVYKSSSDHPWMTIGIKGLYKTAVANS